MDEIMHTCPRFHASNLPNCPPTNLVQVGIGGWQVPRPGVKKGRERGSTVLTIQDIERIGIDKIVEIALEVAWKCAAATPARHSGFPARGRRSAGTPSQRVGRVGGG